MTSQLVGPDPIRKLRAEIGVSLVGIGGITRENVRAVIESSADGVAVISAVRVAPDPLAATREFVAKSRRRAA